jgi:AcrR family transcriptional regulator
MQFVFNCKIHLCVEFCQDEFSSMRAIAAKAGLSASAVNYYYRSKERLVEAALRSAWVHVSEDIKGIMDAPKNGAEGLEAATRFVIEGAYRYPNIIHAIILEHPSLRGEASAISRPCSRSCAAGLLESPNRGLARPSFHRSHHSSASPLTR